VRLESAAAEQPEDNRRRSRARSTLYAGTAALALLVVVGFPYRVTRESTIPVASSPQPPLQNAEEGPGPGPLAGSPIPPDTPAEAAGPAASSVPARVVPLAPRPLTSLRVVHRHRLGSCRGVLAVSRSGIAFVPEESDEGKDAFTFEYGQFIHDLDDGSLTIRSNDRTYRFTAAAAAGRGDNGDELRRLAASIERFR
jgi:hypothetical protein